MELQERLSVFFERLTAAPPAATAQKALALICDLIEAVEDEFCPIPREEPPLRLFTGRMYVPQEDYITRKADGTITATTRHHRITCAADGAIYISHIPRKKLVLWKPAKQP